MLTERDHSRAVLTEEGTLLTLSNVTKDDLLNVQCNISNLHGYIYSDAYLNVYCEYFLSTLSWFYQNKTILKNWSVLQCKIVIGRPEIAFCETGELPYYSLSKSRYSVLFNNKEVYGKSAKSEPWKVNNVWGVFLFSSMYSLVINSFAINTHRFGQTERIKVLERTLIIILWHFSFLLFELVVTNLQPLW